MPLESNCGREAEEEATVRRQVELELPGVGGGGGVGGGVGREEQWEVWVELVKCSSLGAEGAEPQEDFEVEGGEFEELPKEDSFVQD